MGNRGAASTERDRSANRLFPSQPILLNKMANAKKILIRTESHERFIVRRRFPVDSQQICAVCSTRACGMTLDDAAIFYGVSALELIRGIESAAVRAYGTAGGHLLICQKSLEILCNGEK
jgi:hypothetical protein